MRLIIFLLAALCYDSPSFGHAQADSRDNARAIPKRFNRLSKRQDDLGYLEQCSILQFWDKQIGRVNVLAFFDSSWQFSHRQAAMLRVLRERFDRTGFDNIQFFAINASPSEAQYIDRAEIEVEEETWKQIAPSEAEGRPPVVVSPEALVEALGPEVYFIQDTEQLQIWPKLRAFRDQILVIDRCGRLTYQVIVPWSILHFPYVKAAILSTYKDEPCGYCQESPFDTTPTDKNNAASPPEESSTLIVKTESNKPSISSRQESLQESSTLGYQVENNDTPTISEEPPTTIIKTDDEETPSPSSLELSTPSDQVENNDTPSIPSIPEEPSTLSTQTEDEDTQSISEEPSTITDQTEDNYTESITEEPSTITVETDDGQAPSTTFQESSTPTYHEDETDDTPSVSTFYQESSTSSNQDENNDTSSRSEEPSTMTTQTEYNDEPSTSSQESSTPTYQDETDDTPSIYEEQSTPNAQTELPTTFDTSTNIYSPTIPDSNENEFSNFTNNEYADEYSNYTTKGDFDYTTEDVEAPTTDETWITDVTDKLDINNVTEPQTSEIEVQTTTEISNSTSDTQESRLKDSDEIESLDARDVLKSRSTNARSVSPNDGSVNHLEVVDINENQEALESDFLIPIRIIMRAPHVDEYSDRTMKAHEYLVLKTGQADYHEHLDGETKSADDDDEEEHRPVRKKAEAVRRIFGKDESPGLYGEVADYWRNFGNEQLQSSAEEEDEQAQDEDTNYEDGVTLSPTTLTLNNGRENTENPYENPEVVPIDEVEHNNGNAYDHNSDFKEEVDVVDEEAKSKLIAHYSKLLPWLYYVLAK